MGETLGKIQTQFKKTTSDILLWTFRLLSGLMVGVTIGLIVQQILEAKPGEHLLSFMLAVIVVTWAFMKISSAWNFTRLMVFDLICVLLGMLLRLYVVVAPNL